MERKKELADYQKAWAKANPEKKAAQGRRHYQKYREEKILKQRKYYQKNKQQVSEYQRKRRESNPEHTLYRHAKERAIKKGLPFTLRKEDIVVPKKCFYLGIKLSVGIGKLSDNSPTIDRIIPSRGYVLDNIIVVSYKANRMKSNSSYDEFKTLLKNWKKLKERKK